jgi:hypothetical protein
MNPYNETFYNNQLSGTIKSAKEIVPLIVELFMPEKVIDVGCGIGGWLSVFKDKGIGILGLDGEYVSTAQLLIPKERFIPTNLNNSIGINETFDVALSLEVAEHLHPERAETFIAELCSLAPIIVFSAAIPFQGGWSHINEQWQDYWVDLFKKRSFFAFDAIRPQILDNKNVKSWYINNILIFCHADVIDKYPTLRKWPNNYEQNSRFSLVCPSRYLEIQYDLDRTRMKLKYHTIGLILALLTLMSVAIVLFFK